VLGLVRWGHENNITRWFREWPEGGSWVGTIDWAR
jgi:hypothetical protein